jgi:glycosyltransferase involved in cell wall biosynthesis
MSWICCQLGSREHYAIPAALHKEGKLSALLADSWVTAGEARLLRRFSPALAARRHDGVPDALVRGANAGRFLYEARVRLQKLDSWQACMLRIAWFGEWCARELDKVEAQTVFSYSYNARWPFRVAKSRGMQCVLSLIDGGWVHEEIISERTQMYRNLAPEVNAAPSKYWEGLRREIEMADKIIVNSEWSRKNWIEAGVPPEKLVEIPLVYELPESSAGSIQSSVNPLATRHLSHVTGSRPRLKALFLGSVSLAKGVGQLFDAIRMLKNEPVDFTFAGPIGVKIPDEISQLPNVRFLGPVDKATAGKLYRESDVFLFPTLSDGFGLTQLEALGHGLPVIASTHCGQVVEDRANGLVLPEVTPEAIADAIMQLVRDRDLLARLKANARVPDKCHPRHLAPALLALEPQRAAERHG